MRKYFPKPSKIRIKTAFLFFPKFLPVKPDATNKKEQRWLERASWKQVWIPLFGWTDLCWVDNEDDAEEQW